MKICIISNWYPPYATSGAGIYVGNIAKALVRSGHDVSVITMLPNYQGLSSLNPKLRVENGVKVYRFHPILETRWKINLFNKKIIIPFWYLTEFYNPHSDHVIKKILKKEKPDVVHVNYIRGFSSSVMKVVKDLNLPLVYTCHDYHLICPLSLLLHRSGEICTNPTPLCKFWAYMNNKIINSNPDIVITASQFLLNKHMSTGFFKKSKKIVLPHGIELNNLNDTSNINNHRKDFKILYMGQLAKHKGVHILIKAFKKSKKKILPNALKINEFELKKEETNKRTFDILYAGGFWKHKGGLTLIEAFKKIKNENIRLHIFGGGEYEKEFKKLAENDNRIIFYGSIPNEKMIEFYKIADVTVVPSICFEAFGRVIIESFARGTPVIGSNIGGIPEVIKEGHNGFLFEPGNVEQLKQILENIIENPEQLKELSKNAFESAKQYSMDKYIEKLLDIYKEAIELNKNRILHKS
ncbi:MAG: glycosyltransferase family 4 protein [Candidatus Altarchaeaceae archaeon]